MSSGCPGVQDCWLSLRIPDAAGKCRMSFNLKVPVRRCVSFGGYVQGRGGDYEAYIRHISWPRESVPAFVKTNGGPEDSLYHSSGTFSKSSQELRRQAPRAHSPRRNNKVALNESGGPNFWSRVRCRFSSLVHEMLSFPRPACPPVRPRNEQPPLLLFCDHLTVLRVETIEWPGLMHRLNPLHGS